MLIFLGWKREKISLDGSHKHLLVFTLLIGSLFYSSSSTFYFFACQHAGTGLAMVIFFSYPVFVAIAAWLTNKGQINKIALTSLFAILIGLFLLKGQGSTSVKAIGMVLAILAALSYTLYIIGSKRIAHKLPSNLVTILICSGSALISLIWACITHSFAIPASIHTWVYICAEYFCHCITYPVVIRRLKIYYSIKSIYSFCARARCNAGSWSDYAA